MPQGDELKREIMSGAEECTEPRKKSQEKPGHKAQFTRLTRGTMVRVELAHLTSRPNFDDATAATAAGAGVLGVARPAEAEIVFTPAHAVIGIRTGYALDLTNSGTTDFILHGTSSFNCSTVFSSLLAKPAFNNAVEGADYLGLNMAKALAAGQRIGSSQRFVNQGRNGVLMGAAIYSPGGGQYRGNWIHVVNRYLGLKFQINGQMHFGWARLTVKLSLQAPMQVLLTGYAYETQPNTPIIAGEEFGQDARVLSAPRVEGGNAPGAPLVANSAPQPASLGVLALGAQGLSH